MLHVYILVKSVRLSSRHELETRINQSLLLYFFIYFWFAGQPSVFPTICLLMNRTPNSSVPKKWAISKIYAGMTGRVDNFFTNNIFKINCEDNENFEVRKFCCKWGVQITIIWRHKINFSHLEKLQQFEPWNQTFFLDIFIPHRTCNVRISQINQINVLRVLFVNWVHFER